MPNAKTSLDAIKSEVCDTTLIVMSGLVIPALAASLARVVDVGWTPQYVGQLIGVVIVWAITFWRRRLSYGARANTILALLVWLGWSGQVFTTAPTSYVFFVSASAMAAVFYGSAAGVVAVVLSVAITISTYFLIVAGVFPVPTYSNGMVFTTWLSRLASLVVAAAGPVIAVSQFRQSLFRELKRAEATSDAKSAFLATMSHELRTPMTAIIGTAELLQDEALTEDQAGKVGRIARAGKNLLSLLNDLLDFAKIEAEQMSIDRVAFSVTEFLGDVQALFAPLAAEKNLTLRIDNSSGHDALVGDPARLRQILSNLVGNAIKFTNRGEIVISAAQVPRGADAVSLHLAVTDHGIGINAADQARLFQPFVQAQNFRSRSHGGTGLGLAISRRLAAQMGGQLSVASVVGKGSTFTLDVPLEVASGVVAPRAPLRYSEVREASNANRPVLKILLAEDNEAIRDLMREMIGRRGHVVDAVDNGLEALHAVQKQAYDVVIMDMHMPIMDGAEATAAIRALAKPLSAIPIVALTAGLTEDQRRAYLAAGVNQIVAKPAHWPTLFEAVESRGASFHAESTAFHAESTAFHAENNIAPSPAAFDEPLFAELEEALGPETMRAALATFRTSMREYESGLLTTLKAEDLAAARRIGHALKGTGRQFGAAEVATLGAAIEAKDATLADMRRAAALLPDALARFDAALGLRTSGATAAATAVTSIL